MYSQVILIEYGMTNPVSYCLKSQSPIDFKRVVKHFRNTEGFNPEKDAMTFIDSETTVDLDGIEV